MPKFPDLRARYLEWIKGNRGNRSGPHGNWASQLGDPCERRIYLDRIDAKAKPISDELFGIFQLGTDWEQVARLNYQRMGFRLELSQQRFEKRDEETGEVLWSGKVDGVLVDEVTGERYAVDTKSAWNAEKIGDQYRAKYLAQLELYMSRDALDIPRGMLIPFDKVVGLPAQINVERSDEHYQALLDKARRINDAVKNESPPPFANDPACCKTCRFRGLSCHPSVTVSGIGIISDEGMASALREAVELEDIGKRHKELSDSIKDRFKGNADGEYLTEDGITVKVKRSKSGSVRVTWKEADND